MIKAVIFDMYETLITHYACPLYFSEEMAMDAGISLEEFRKEWRATEHDRSIGKLTTDEVISQILHRHECYSDEKLSMMMLKRIQTKEECFKHLHPEIVPLLKSLKEKGILIGLISNCFSEEAKVIRESSLYPYFDAALLSCEEGVEKPNKEIFLRCMSSLNVKPEECIYVGDGGSQELEAAKSLGMYPLQALWYRNKKSEHVIKLKEGFEQLENPMNILNYL
jgi:putative hydrolase of the HAD superfamily